MKIFLVCSKSFYDKAKDIGNLLLDYHEIAYPNCFNNSMAESQVKELGKESHLKFKQAMYKESYEKIAECDAILVLNYTKNGINGYIGGATFLEMYDAYTLNKKIYMLNELDKNSILYDEVCGFDPIILNNNISILNDQITN